MRDLTVTCACALLLLAPPALVAQRAEAWRDSSVVALRDFRALRDSLMQGDSTTAEVARRGRLVIGASPNEVVPAKSALIHFDSVRTWRYGDALPSAHGFRIVDRTTGAPGAVARVDGAVAAGTVRESGEVVLEATPDSADAPQVQFGGRTDELANELLDHFGDMMIASSPALTEWIGSPPPLSMNEQQRRDEAMYAFITTNGDAPRQCISGVVASCDVALRLTGDPANEDRQFNSFLRADLLYFALAAGGPGAWERMRDAEPLGLPTMLGAASRLPADSVVARWRRELLQRQPHVATISPATAILALGWSALLLLGALGASKWA